MKASELATTEYKSYYQTYISKAGQHKLLDGLELSFNNTLDFYNTLPSEKLEYAYADGKWTIKEIIQHLIDTERVFTYRALSIGRGDSTNLPGFDENAFAANSSANKRTMLSLIEEYTHLRNASLQLYNSFSNEMLLETGIASGGNLSVRAIGFILIGHETHHCEVIRERYL